MPVWLPYAITWTLSTILGGAAVYAAMRSTIAGMEIRITRLESDVGTHETGLRGSSHAMAQKVTEALGRIGIMEHRIKALEEHREIR